MGVTQVTKIHWSCDRCHKAESVESVLDPNDSRTRPEGWERFEWVNSRSGNRKTADVCRECNNAICDLMHGVTVPKLG